MDSLPPIPTPPEQRWREFKIRILPVIVFLFVTTVICLMWKNLLQPPGLISAAPAETAGVPTQMQDVLKHEHQPAQAVASVKSALSSATKVLGAGE